MPNPRRKPHEQPNTGPRPVTQLHLTREERQALKALTPAGTPQATTLTQLIRAECARRLRRTPARPPAPRTLHTTHTPHTTHSPFKFPVDVLAQLERLITHYRDTEGLTLDRTGVVRRLLHDEQRRTQD